MQDQARDDQQDEPDGDAYTDHDGDQQEPAEDRRDGPQQLADARIAPPILYVGDELHDHAGEQHGGHQADGERQERQPWDWLTRAPRRGLP